MQHAVLAAAGSLCQMPRQRGRQLTGRACRRRCGSVTSTSPATSLRQSGWMLKVRNCACGPCHSFPCAQLTEVQALRLGTCEVCASLQGSKASLMISAGLPPLPGPSGAEHFRPAHSSAGAESPARRRAAPAAGAGAAGQPGLCALLRAVPGGAARGAGRRRGGGLLLAPGTPLPRRAPVRPRVRPAPAAGARGRAAARAAAGRTPRRAGRPLPGSALLRSWFRV